MRGGRGGVIMAKASNISRLHADPKNVEAASQKPENTAKSEMPATNSERVRARFMMTNGDSANSYTLDARAVAEMRGQTSVAPAISTHGTTGQLRSVMTTPS